MMFKSLNGETPEYLSNKFIFRNDTTSHRLRNSEMRLAFPQSRTDFRVSADQYHVILSRDIIA